DYLQAYHWPGNIRELRNVIRRACLLTGSGKEISKTSLPENLVMVCEGKWQHSKSFSFHDQGQDRGLDLKSMAQNAEAKHIIEVLNNVNFNKTKAAKLLNIDRKTLYQKLKLFKIS